MNNSHRFFENRDCEYYPCHEGTQVINCLFCYCPLYRFDDCPGNPAFKERNGTKLKVCTGCNFPHIPENYDLIISVLRDQMNLLSDPEKIRKD